ncbi:MAG: molybdopterin converting factor subunit 1 [Saprospiraceae bacterium]|nr:molybdopterin converting factor subunit 1 [Saprospiraceae bacterium]
MKIKILTFGIAREICGGSSIQADVPEGTTAAALKHHLAQQFPRLAGLASFLLAVNEEFAADDTLIHPGDEVAIIPPVSGG